MLRKTIAVSHPTWKSWISILDLESGHKPYSLDEAVQKAHLHTESFKRRQKPVSASDWVRARNAITRELPKTLDALKLLTRGTDEYRRIREKLLFVNKTLKETEEGIGNFLAFLPDDRGNFARAQALMNVLDLESEVPPGEETLRVAQEVVQALEALDVQLGEIIEPHVASRTPPPWLKFAQQFFVRINYLKFGLEDLRIARVRGRQLFEEAEQQREYRASLVAALDGTESLLFREVSDHITHDVIVKREADIPQRDQSKFTLTVYPHPGKFHRTLLALLEVVEAEIAEGREAHLFVPKKAPQLVGSVMDTEAMRFSFQLQVDLDHVVAMAKKIGEVLARDQIEPHPKMSALHRKTTSHPAIAIVSPETGELTGPDAFYRADTDLQYGRTIRQLVRDTGGMEFLEGRELEDYFRVGHRAPGIEPLAAPHVLSVFPHPEDFEAALRALLILVEHLKSDGHHFIIRIPKQAPKAGTTATNGVRGPFGIGIEATENELAWVADYLCRALERGNIRPHENMPTDARIPNLHDALTLSLPNGADGQVVRRTFDPFTDITIKTVVHRSHSGRWTYLGGKLGIASLSPSGKGKRHYEPRDTVGVISTQEKLVVSLASGFGPPHLGGAMARLVGEALIERSENPATHLHQDVFFDEVRKGLLRNHRVPKGEDPGAAYMRVTGFWNGGFLVEHGGNVRVIFKRPGEDGFHILSLDQSGVPAWVLNRWMEVDGFHPPLSGDLARRYYEDMRIGERLTVDGADTLHTADATPWQVSGGIYYRKKEVTIEPRISEYKPQPGRAWSAPGSLCIIMTADISQTVKWADLATLSTSPLTSTDLAKKLVEKAGIGTAIVFRF